MDRNLVGSINRAINIIVALRKESVDRNVLSLLTYHQEFGSLSARRAWIEIGAAWVQEFPELVALRKESVDRNVFVYGFGWEV